MTWHNIHGHDDVVELLRRALARRRLASSFLFTGPAGVGKFTFAMKLAEALLCHARPEEMLDPCGQCPACMQVRAGTHPDLTVVAKPKDRSFIPLDLLIGDKEHRRREGLCHNIAMKPMMGGRKVAIIDDADRLNAEGANSLLKTLEEPPPLSVLILIGTSPAKQLPTIRSRCQLIRFRGLPVDVVAELLGSLQPGCDPAEVRRLAEHCEGSLQRAVELADPELWTFRGRLLAKLAEPTLDSVRLAKAVLTFVDEAGKQPAARRERLRKVVALAADFYRHLLHAQSGAPEADDRELRQHVTSVLESGAGDAETTAARLELCLDAAEQIDRNANQTTLIESWLDELGVIGG
ncbi:MAG: DNA polymerase III subunit delta' [Candidatus Nealsonbacteria bacterium]|nr:DNA polymerase III subunit delta' [Candidatus Nealsonbacteria bacterium]